MNIDQIKEIKKGVTHSKLALWQALHDMMQIEEVDLMDYHDMTLDRMSEVRKKLTLTSKHIRTSPPPPMGGWELIEERCSRSPPAPQLANG